MNQKASNVKLSSKIGRRNQDRTNSTFVKVKVSLKCLNVRLI